MTRELKLKRIVLENTQYHHKQIRIDLICEGNKIKSGTEYFGLWQDTVAHYRCPFTLSNKGVIDFGSGYDDEDRYYKTNLLEKEMEMGQLITSTEDEPRTQGESGGVFRVVNIVPLI